MTLLNGHFSDSDGGADGTVGKLSVTREMNAESPLMRSIDLLLGK